MKEAIGQTFIVNLILFFFVILVLLFFGSINYSKAYKTKNRLITIIEKYGGYPTEDEGDTKVIEEINDNMVKAGYQTVTDYDTLRNKCKGIAEREGIDDAAVLYPNPTYTSTGRMYEYCVIKRNSTIGSYYQVVVYMRFEIPIIGSVLNFPVMGETKILYDNIDIPNE